MKLDELPLCLRVLSRWMKISFKGRVRFFRILCVYLLSVWSFIKANAFLS